MQNEDPEREARVRFWLDTREPDGEIGGSYLEALAEQFYVRATSIHPASLTENQRWQDLGHLFTRQIADHFVNVVCIMPGTRASPRGLPGTYQEPADSAFGELATTAPARTFANVAITFIAPQDHETMVRRAGREYIWTYPSELPLADARELRRSYDLVIAPNEHTVKELLRAGVVACKASPRRAAMTIQEMFEPEGS